MNKVIIITGGSDCLSKTIANNLSKDNCDVILSPTEDKLINVDYEVVMSHVFQLEQLPLNYFA